MRSEATQPYELIATTRRRLSSWCKWIGCILGMVTMPHACIVPELGCEFTKTCSDVDPTETTDSDTSEAGFADASGANRIEDASHDARTRLDAAADTSATVARIACQYVGDCPDELPVCDAVAKVCTKCDNNIDCGASPNTPHCKSNVGHEQDNSCVQCLGDGDCDQGICVDNACVSCNVRNDDGCNSLLPQCVLIDDAPTCVVCDGNEHCSYDLPLCAGNQCVLCTSEDASYCPREAPVCDAENIPGRCISCANDEDCTSTNANVAGLCIDEQCTACELGTSRNCSDSAPYCVALLPEKDGGVSLFAPDLTSTLGGAPPEQYLEFQHQCVECLDDSVCVGSKKGCFAGACVRCTTNDHCNESPEASVCDTSTHTCVGCSSAEDCVHLPNTPACDVDKSVCVECTAERDAYCLNRVCRTVPGPEQFTCTNRGKHARHSCAECWSDSDCPTNSACVLESYEGVDTGFYCLPMPVEKKCEPNQPLIDSIVATSVDGTRTVFCKMSLTTCQGYRHYGIGTATNDAGLGYCNSDDDCGLPGVDDGICLSWPDDIKRCTYECNIDADCPRSICVNMADSDNVARRLCLIEIKDLDQATW
jgi:hypothetical protein